LKACPPLGGLKVEGVSAVRRIEGLNLETQVKRIIIQNCGSVAKHFCEAKTNPALFFIKHFLHFYRKIGTSVGKKTFCEAKQKKANLRYSILISKIKTFNLLQKVHSFNLNYCIEKNSTKTFPRHTLVALDKFSIAHHYDMEWLAHLLGQ
jgi:hypothetical protein